VGTCLEKPFAKQWLLAMSSNPILQKMKKIDLA
jgi:hypothetical protein